MFYLKFMSYYLFAMISQMIEYTKSMIYTYSITIWWAKSSLFFGIKPLASVARMIFDKWMACGAGTSYLQPQLQQGQGAPGLSLEGAFLFCLYVN
jgi:hypothetical protein